MNCPRCGTPMNGVCPNCGFPVTGVKVSVRPSPRCHKATVRLWLFKCSEYQLSQ